MTHPNPSRPLCVPRPMPWLVFHTKKEGYAPSSTTYMVLTEIQPSIASLTKLVGHSGGGRETCAGAAMLTSHSCRIYDPVRIQPVIEDPWPDSQPAITDLTKPVSHKGWTELVKSAHSQLYT